MQRKQRQTDELRKKVNFAKPAILKKIFNICHCIHLILHSLYKWITFFNIFQILFQWEVCFNISPQLMLCHISTLYQ